jgi:uncharacterized YigZ family protein
MTDITTFRTISEPVTGYIRDRGSKFIGWAYPVTSEEEIRQVLAQVRKQYHDAHHHCYAWALGPGRSQYRMNDDGEPSGSAGKPIYGQILSKDLTDILVMVIRYFGGTKLGIPGLIQAYRGAAQEALQQATLVSKSAYDLYEIRCEYIHLNDIMVIIKEFGLDQLETTFDSECRVVVGSRKNQSDTMVKKLSALKTVRVTYIGSAFK